ncbi:MAG: hypothetical protein IJ149_08670 [Oscillospiraceae bacterium]|nr:hypothetical protein [Oscillospiraceae bacterium]
MKRLRQRLISGITALSIFASSMFPAVTVFSEEYTQPAVTDAPESVTDSVQTGTGVPTSDEVFYLPADAGEQETFAETGEIASDGTDAFSCKNGNVDISVSVRDGVYTVADGTEIPVSNVAFTAYEVNIDDQGYPIDLDRRVNVVRAYNTAWTWESVRIVPASGTARFTYNFTEDVPAEYADSVTVYGVQFGEWTAVDMEYPVVEGGLVKSVSFETALPDLSMFALSWTDPAAVKPDEAIVSSDREYDYAAGNITACATAFTGAIFTADEENEYGAVPVNANTAALSVDELAADDERTAPFAVSGDETVRVYAPKFSSEKYADVSVSDYSVQVTYALDTPVPEAMGYSCMAFAAADGGISMIPSEKVIENGYIKAITFTANDVFAVYENIELKTLTASAEDEYTITLKYDKGAGIPDGAELIAVPMDADDFIADMAEALGWTDEDMVLYTRLFDITIEKDGEEFEPLTPVTVTAQLHDVEEVPEAMQVVHIDDEGATEVEIGASEGEQYTFETESFSVYGFGSALHTVIEESTDIADISVYTLSADVDVTAQDTQLDTPVEGVIIDRAYGLAGDTTAKLWIKAEVSENAELGDRESVSLYGVDNGIVTRPILADITENEGLLAAPSGVTAIAVARDTGLRRQTAEAHPDGEESGKIVSLSGMMPINAQASAADVTGSYMQAYEQYSLDEKPLAAYDISILENSSEGTAGEQTDSAPAVSTKYQPDEEHPIEVVITDPRITASEGVKVYHFAADGSCQEVEDFTAEEGKITFTAYGFSVYEIVETVFEYEYDIVDIGEGSDPANFSAQLVQGEANFLLDVVPVNFEGVDTTQKITTVAQLKSYLDAGKNGFYISSTNNSDDRGGAFATGSVRGNIQADRTIQGIATTLNVQDDAGKKIDENGLDLYSLLENAVDVGAEKYYFDQDTDNNYYIYRLDGENKCYIKNIELGNTTVKFRSLDFTNDKNDATLYNIANQDNGNLRIRTTIEGKDIYWNYHTKTTSDKWGFATWNEPENNSKLYFWYYTPPAEVTEDPTGLDGQTYGLVSAGDGKNSALMAGYAPNSNNILGGLKVTSGNNTETGNDAFSTIYGISGWTFEWREGTATYKICALADDGNTKKYLQINNSGIQLVDEADASAFTVSRGTTPNTIKLTANGSGINWKNDNEFQKGDATEFYLVDLSAGKEDALSLNGKSYGLVNKNNDYGVAMMDLPKEPNSNYLLGHAVFSDGDGYSSAAGITKWTFEHVDFNRYCIKNEDGKYLKLSYNNLSMSDYPYILTVLPGSLAEGDAYDGTVKIVNTSVKAELYRSNNSSFDHPGKTQNYTLDRLKNYEPNRWLTPVIVPEDTANDPLGLDGKTYGIVNPIYNKGVKTGGYAMTSSVSGSELPRKQVSYDTATGKYKLANNLVTGWTFHYTDHNNYILSVTADDGTEKYLRFRWDGLALVDEAYATPVCVEAGTGELTGKVRIMPLYDGSISFLWCGNSDFQRKTGVGNKLSSNAWHELVEIPVVSEPYKLDGKTYGLFHYVDGETRGTAFMAAPPNHSLTKMIIHDNNTSSVLYVDENNEVDEWTFEYQGDGTYKIYTGSGYLSIADGTVSVTDEANASLFTVSVDTYGRIQLRSAGYYLSYEPPENNIDTGTFISSTVNDDKTWLRLIEKTTVDETEQIARSADRISVSDLVNGEQYIIYTRIWNNDEKRYDMYAVDHDGTLYPVYASGGKIVWLGDSTDSLLWTFIEHYDEVSHQPNYYYDFYNPYSEKYIAPQLYNGQVLSEDRPGLQMTGRKGGDYYSIILAWDDARYTYAALKDSDDNSRIESCPQSAAWPFYFATLEPINLLDELHEVATVDNNEHGITMKMVDYGFYRDPTWEKDKDYGGVEGADVSYGVFGGVNSYKDTYGTNGILSTELGDDGYPKVTAKFNAETPSLIDAFHSTNRDAIEVNHLFLESVYNSGGYFEYDSTQNFATLVDGINDDGSLVYTDNDFKVYRELGTHDRSDSISLKHGQFFPYDTIKARSFASTNPQNMTNWYRETLDESDPRKYETLYLIQTDKITSKQRTDKDGKPVEGDINYIQKQANYYFGMEMEASFVQTPSGLDKFGHDMIFQFTGDDDFWLYVDGELVLDLGGCHPAQGGTVNFRTGEIKYNNRNNNKTTTLLSVFRDNYKARYNITDNNDPTLIAYLEKYFGYDSNNVMEPMFKDYSTHEMKVFYMERGGNASNLYMHFNLSSITPGNVTVSKEVKDEDGNAANINTDMLQYPFQIWYLEPINESSATDMALWNSTSPELKAEIVDGGVTKKCLWHQLKNDSENVYVTYQNSSQKIVFVDRYEPPGTTGVYYDNIYYISPGKNFEIHIPTDYIQYKLVECAVDDQVYDVKINGNPVAPQAGSQHGHLVSYVSEPANSQEMPVVSFDNIIKKDAMRTLEITKRIVDKDGNEITDDDTKFKLRLYLSTLGAEAEQLGLADMVPYRLVSPDGYYCQWDADTQTFVPTEWVYKKTGEPSTNLKTLSEAQLESITFHSSQYGTIDKIPSQYKICVPDLPAGTVFKIEERENEMPSGYDLYEYRHVMGRKVVEGQEDESVPSYEEILSVGENHVYNVGKVILDQDAQVDVVNKKGYSLRVNKKWSDLELTTSHAPIYTAVYVRGELLPGTVRRIKSPDVSTYYFWPALEPGETTLANYKVYEVIPSNPTPTVDETTGKVTDYGELTRLENGTGRLEDHEATLVMEEGQATAVTKEFDYVANYAQGEGESSRVDTITNVREGALQLRLYAWDVSGSSQTNSTPLGSGIFKVTGVFAGKEEAETRTFTSAGDGTIAIIYDYKVGEPYTLEQVAAPKGYIGLLNDLSDEEHPEYRNPVSFTVNNNKTVTVKDKDGNTWTHGLWVNGKDGANGISGFVDVYNKPLNFKVIKMDPDNTRLDGVHFSLYKQVKNSIGGDLKSKTPLTGFEDIVTDANGELVLSGKVTVTGDNGEEEIIERMLYPGETGTVYYLEETRPKQGYALPEEDIVFRLSPVGEPSIIRGGELHFEERDNEYILTVDVTNIKNEVALTINKKVEGGFGDRVRQFKFTLTVGDGRDTETEYAWTLNGVEQEKIKSGGSFSLRHGDVATFMLPPGNVTVTEANLGYDVKIDKYLTDTPDDTTAQATTQNSSYSFALSDNTTLDVTNSLNGAVPTGADLPDVSVFFAGFLALGAVLLARRQRLFAENDTDGSDNGK